MNELKKGLTYISKLKVTKEYLACNMGSGDMEVLATPSMIALMENAAMLCVQPTLAEGETTVGISINSTHIKATAPNNDIEAVATIIEIDGRKITLNIVARDGEGVIGEATHERFVVNREKFLSKLESV